MCRPCGACRSCLSSSCSLPLPLALGLNMAARAYSSSPFVLCSSLFVRVFIFFGRLLGLSQPLSFLILSPSSHFDLHHPHRHHHPRCCSFFYSASWQALAVQPGPAPMPTLGDGLDLVYAYVLPLPGVDKHSKMEESLGGCTSLPLLVGCRQLLFGSCRSCPCAISIGVYPSRD